MKVKKTVALREEGLQQLTFNFNMAGLFEGYTFVLHQYIKIFYIHCSFACNIQFLDIIGAAIDNSIFASVTSFGTVSTALQINNQTNTAYYQYPANYSNYFFTPIITKSFRISKQSSTINTYFFYKNYSAS